MKASGVAVMANGSELAFHVRRARWQNFARFKDQTIEFPDPITALVGRNASGKSALLEGLRLGVSDMLTALPGGGVPLPISPWLIRRDQRAQTTPETQLPDPESTRVSLDVTWMSEALELGREIAEADADTQSTRAPTAPSMLASDEATWPLMCCYSFGGRARFSEAELVQGYDDRPRLAAYRHALDWTVTEKSIHRNVAQLADVEPFAEELAGVALDAFTSGAWRAVRLDQTRKEPVFERASGRRVALSELSDGERDMFALLVDISIRCCRLNSHLHRDAVTRTPGIVLLDEPEVHIHPGWERDLVPALRATFPSMQFILSTHSPFIVQALPPSAVVSLHEGGEAEAANQGIEDILELIMTVPLPQMSRRRREMLRVAGLYLRLLDRAAETDAADIEQIKRDLDELTEPFSNDMAYMALLNLEREKAGLGEGEDETG